MIYKIIFGLVTILTASLLSGHSDEDSSLYLTFMKAQLKTVKDKYEESLGRFLKLERNSTFVIDASIFNEVNASRDIVLSSIYCVHLDNKKKYVKQEEENYRYYLVELMAYKYSNGIDYSSEFKTLVRNSGHVSRSGLCAVKTKEAKEARDFFEKKLENKILNFYATMNTMLKAK